MHTRGFTLVELLITVALIGIIAGIVAVNFSGSLSGSQKKKSKAHIGSVLRLVEQQKAIKKPHLRIAEAVGEGSFELWEKVVGTTPYLAEYAKGTNAGICDTTGEVYKFLDKLDGSGQTPIYVRGQPGRTAPRNTDRIYCMETMPGDPAGIAVRVTDDVWWCTTLDFSPEYKGYFTTNATGKINFHCSHSVGDTRTTYGDSVKSASILKEKIDDYFTSDH